MFEYPAKHGPLGSSKRKEILNSKEIFRLVSLPRSKLASYWKRDEITKWASAQGSPCIPYKPSRKAEALARETYLPGDKCADCKKIREKWLACKYNLTWVVFPRTTSQVE